MALTDKEVLELRGLEGRVRKGLPLTDSEETRLLNLEGRLEATVVRRLQDPKPLKSVFDLEISRWAWEGDAGDLESY